MDVDDSFRHCCGFTALREEKGQQSDWNGRLDNGCSRRMLPSLPPITVPQTSRMFLTRSLHC